ncbi:MAG: 50S ribosomal protein L13 [Candidatus Pacebacteria bacterium]|nr:50S ribosomal protein L13 [Candidatus Paceibacterota bacterium]
MKKEIKIDATGIPLGRLAVEVALTLQGKKSVNYAPNKEPDNVVVISNVSKMKITGNKLETETYFKHTGYLGNDKHTPMGVIFEKNPGQLLKFAVSGMLPKNRLRDRHLKRLKFE